MFAYRILRPDEYERLINNLPIIAKNPQSTKSISKHIIRTSQDTPWISASKDFSILLKHMKKESFENAVIKIDLSKVEEYHDISTTENQLREGLIYNKAKQYAKSRKEIVIKGEIPNNACTIIIKPNEFSNALKWKSASTNNVCEEYKHMNYNRNKSEIIYNLRKKLNRYPTKHLSRYKMQQIMITLCELDTITENNAIKWYSLKYYNEDIA